MTTLHVAPVANQRVDLVEMLRHATLGEYEILAELGRGGMATVYLAHDIALGRKVAVKVMSPTLFSGEGMAERFKREARTAAQLSHPHIIPIYSVQDSGDLLFFVMKFIEGRPLDSIIKEVGPLPIPMVRTILMQVGGALGYAHRRGVIHRDIKPANIMLDADGWAIVTDFGIAKVSETQGLTVTGATVGTPSYMSPEQCAAQELTGATDQYSLGVVAYEMLSGKLPFIAESVMAVMYAHFNQPPRPVVQIRADCPIDLAATVMRMLEKDPAQRFPNLEAATAAMGSVNLSPDDPVRTQMMTLAAAGENMKLLQRFSTPVSQPSVVGSAVTSGRRSSLATLTMVPARVTIAVGGAVQLRATPKTRAGQALPRRPVTWASTNPDIAIVSETGLVTAIAPGTVTITASSADTSATATVTVVATRRRNRTLGLVAGGVTAAVVAGLVAFQPWRSGGESKAAQPRDTGASLPPAVAIDSPIATKPRAPKTSDTTAVTTSPTPAPTRGNPRDRPHQPADTSDATVATALVTARAARDRAVAAGAGQSDLASGDAELTQAQTLRASGRRIEAFGHLRTASTLFSAAETSATAARVSAQPPSAPPPDTTPKTVSHPVPPPPSPPADPAPEIRQTIGFYAHALEARSLDDVVRVWPDLPQAQADKFRQFFSGAKEIQASWTATNIVPNGDEAEVRVTMTLTFKSADSQPGRTESELTIRLRRQNGSWVITAIR